MPLGLPLDCHWIATGQWQTPWQGLWGGLRGPPKRAKMWAAEQPFYREVMLREGNSCRCLVSIFAHYLEIFFRKPIVDASSASSCTIQRSSVDRVREQPSWREAMLREDLREYRAERAPHSQGVMLRRGVRRGRLERSHCEESTPLQKTGLQKMGPVGAVSTNPTCPRRGWFSCCMQSSKSPINSEVASIF